VIDITLAARFTEMYTRQESILDFLIEAAVPKRVMLRTYDLLVKEDLIPIEKLPDEVKKQLVAECRKTNIRFTNQSLREAARILHTLKFVSGT
jgi:hypothetical protein